MAIDVSRDVEVCDAIVGQLNSSLRAWTGKFLATHDWLTDYDNDPTWSLKDLQVSVLALTMETMALSRGGHNMRRFEVAIVIQKDVDISTAQKCKGTCDPLAKIAEQIHDFYLADANKKFTTDSGKWTITQAKRPDVFDWRKLYSEAIWSTIILLTVEQNQ